jgi:hypothetical protein
MMKQRILVGAMLAIFTAAPAFAATHALLPAQPGDLVPTILRARTVERVGPQLRHAPASPATPQIRMETQPVSISWALPHDSPVQSDPQPFTRSSREYWMDVSASDLQQGVKLPLTAPGALIRLSPGDAQVGRLQPDNVRVQLGQQTLNASDATSQLADTQSLKAVGMDVPEASMVMKLKPELGSGVATLQVAAASGRYLVHVFEPQSAFTVTARADHNDLLLGGNVKLRVAMQDDGKPLPLNAVGGFLRAPDGSTTLLIYRRQSDGSYAASAQPRSIPSTPGLWEVHSFTSGTNASGQEVRRDTTTVFSAAVPDARLDGLVTTARASDKGIDITLGVTARSASRFAVSGVLYGRDDSGRMVPAAFAQSAAVLSSGSGKLVLHYDAASIVGVDAPYELHDLRLQDQPAVGLLERHAVALRFSSL